MKNIEGIQAAGSGYIWIVVNVENGYLCINDSEKKHSELPSPMGETVHELIHASDLPLFHERIRNGESADDFVPFSFRLRDEYHSPLYVEKMETIDDQHALLHVFPIRMNPVQLAPENSHGNCNSTFFELMDEAGIQTSPDGQVLKINESFSKEYGWSDDDLADDIFHFIPKDRRHEFYVTKSRLLAGEKMVSLQTIRLKKDGTRVPVSIRVFPVLDAKGRLAATTATFVSQDSAAVTKSLIQLQERIIKDRDQLIIDIMENTDLGIGQYDYILKRFVYLNPAVEGLFDVGLNDIYADPLAFLRHVHPDDREELSLKLYHPEDTYSDTEYRLVTPGKAMKWMRTKSVPIRDRDGRVLRLIGFTQDITKRRFSEEMNLKWEKLGTVGHLAAGIAHEVRNPLTAVKGFIQLLEETGADKSYTEIVMDQLNRIELIVDELLMLAEPHHEIEMKPADLGRTLSEVIKLLGAEARLHDSYIRYKGPNYPLVAICKTDEIKHVMINLVKNSLEAMPCGGTVYVTAWDAGDGPTIEVKDEGIGISEERLPRLGEPFYSNKEKGTGMGLMKSFKIIERHGGSIEFESDIGCGTTATIRLPSANDSTISGV